MKTLDEYLSTEHSGVASNLTTASKWCNKAAWWVILAILDCFSPQPVSEIQDRKAVSAQGCVCAMSIDSLRLLIQRNSWCWKASSPRQDPQLFTETYISQNIFQILSTEILCEACFWKKLMFSATSSWHTDWQLNLCLWTMFPEANFSELIWDIQLTCLIFQSVSHEN